MLFGTQRAGAQPQETNGAQQYGKSGRQDNPQTIGHRAITEAHDVSDLCSRIRDDVAAAEYGASCRHATHYTNAEPVRQIFVKTDTGRTLAVHVSSWHDPVVTIKMSIRERRGVPEDRQRLTFAGKPVTQDEQTTAQYGIGQYCTVEMLGHLRGGMPAKNDPAKGDTTMATVETTTNPTAANSSLLAWSKWVQGPYQA